MGVVATVGASPTDVACSPVLVEFDGGSRARSFPGPGPADSRAGATRAG